MTLEHRCAEMVGLDLVLSTNCHSKRNEDDRLIVRLLHEDLNSKLRRNRYNDDLVT
jgi:hypothetical protein